MAGGPALMEEEEQLTSPLVAPDPYEPVYKESQRMNPRRQLWAGMLMDMGNLFGGWNGSDYGGRQLQGTGFKMQNQARNWNARMDAANQQAQRQHRLDSNQFAGQQQAHQQRQNTMQDAAQARAMGVNPQVNDQEINRWNAAGRPGTLEEWLEKRAAMSRSALGDRRTSEEKNFSRYQQILRDQGPAAAAQFWSNVTKYGGFQQGGTRYQLGQSGQYQAWHPGRGWVDVDPDNALAVAEAKGSLAGNEAATESTITSQADVNNAFQTEVTTKVPKLRSALSGAEDLQQQIASGKFRDTGFLEGRYKGRTTFEGAQLAAKSVMAALENLQITNLAPVTENEIKMIMQLGTNLLNDPEANMGALEEVVQRTRKVLQEYGRQQHYYDQNKTLSGYGVDWLRNSEFYPGGNPGGGSTMQAPVAPGGGGHPGQAGHQPITPPGSTVRWD